MDFSSVAVIEVGTLLLTDATMAVPGERKGGIRAQREGGKTLFSTSRIVEKWVSETAFVELLYLARKKWFSTPIFQQFAGGTLPFGVFRCPIPYHKFNTGLGLTWPFDLLI